MILRILRPLFTAEALGVIFFLSALATFTSGIAASVSGTVNTQAVLLISLAAAGVAFGWSKTRINGIQASAGIVALGVIFLWILGARLTQPLLVLITQAFSMLTNQIDSAPLQETWALISEASLALWARLQTWLSGFNANVIVNDSLIRNLFWMLVLWLVSAWAGWHAAKRNALMALLPAIIVLALVTAYSEEQVEFLLMILILLLLLMGIWQYKTHISQWQRTRVDFSESIPIDVGQAVMLITFSVAALAAVTPSLTWNDVVEFFQERTNNDTAEMLGIQRPPVSAQGIGAPQPTLPRDYLLAGEFAASEEIVITIRTGELPPLPSEMLPAPAPRYYWRVVVYDEYKSTGWVTSTVNKQKISANTPLLPGLLKDHRLVHAEVQAFKPEGRLIWSGTLFSADVPFTAQWRLRPTSDLFANQTALLQSDLFTAASEANLYQIDTYLPTVTVTDLRSASSEYPEEIFNTYLVLPSKLPTRVRDLALEITDGIENPYEKAKAIESYLRTNYPYDLNVPSPPSEQDVTDYFLFDLRRGYCDYYATAMVVLARVNGLPARFVSGYTSGTYDAPNAQYVIRELNAHSWVEIYFPEIGWVEFEPTASEPEIQRQREEDLNLPPPSEDQQTAAQLLTRFRLERILLWLSPLGGLLLLGVLYFFVIQRWLLLRFEPKLAIHRIYQMFYRAGRALVGEWLRSGTAAEYLARIIFVTEETEKRSNKNFRDLRERSSSLTYLYQTSLFADHYSSKQDVIFAWNLWKQIRVQLIWLRLSNKKIQRSPMIRKIIRP